MVLPSHRARRQQEPECRLHPAALRTEGRRGSHPTHLHRQESDRGLCQRPPGRCGVA